jgi:nucleotide-binding universal stress UspA family protein
VTHAAQREEAQAALARAVAAASAAGVKAESRLLSGKPHEQILDTAKASGCDLIVVGRHGETNLIRTPFGGTTQKVIGLAETPVLVVRA